MVPVNNLPIIFYIFQKFPKSQFKIIADYKTEVLERYLESFGFAYDYSVIKTDKKGTASGIKLAIEDFEDNESFMLLWCDLILGNNFKIPER